MFLLTNSKTKTVVKYPVIKVDQSILRSQMTEYIGNTDMWGKRKFMSFT